MDTTVVIPVRDDPDGLRRSLAGLQRQIVTPDAVLVVNAGDTPLPGCATEGIAIRELRVGPAMPGAARNAGAAIVGTKWLAFLDAGTEPPPSWLAAFSEAADATPEAEVLFGSYVPRMQDDWDWAAIATYLAPPNTAELGRSPTTASMCLRRSTWDRLGGMSDDLRAGEDLIFFERIAACGAKTAVVPKAQVTWDLPAGPSGHYRRLRSYSRATWPTALSRRWQQPVLRMYLTGALAALAFLVSYPPLIGLVGALTVARLVKAVVERWHALPRPATLSRLARIPVMLAVADFATLSGVADEVMSTLRTQPARP